MQYKKMVKLTDSFLQLFFANVAKSTQKEEKVFNFNQVVVVTARNTF
jgi:hypothetical protein